MLKMQLFFLKSFHNFDTISIVYFNRFYKFIYGRLYPANPFDWLILNCVRSLDEVDPYEDMDAEELFNETIILFAKET
jgi:hypothetical protein